MSEELQDEITSINSIYGDSTLVALSDSGSDIYVLTLPAQPEITLRVEFPADYPNASPTILGTQHLGPDIAKGQGQYLVGIVREVLSEVYVPGSPCIFDLIEESTQELRQHGFQDAAGEQEPQATQASSDGQIAEDWPEEDISDHDQASDELVKPPPWVSSEVVTEKKSIFFARAAPVTSVNTAKSYLAHLLATDRKVAKATHNITAWRIRGQDGVQYQDCDDDGETAAGGRLLHLLELMGAWDVMVVVSRWYGGVQLGPDRFRIINQTARDAIVKGGFIETGGDGKEKKAKGKK